MQFIPKMSAGTLTIYVARNIQIPLISTPTYLSTLMSYLIKMRLYTFKLRKLQTHGRHKAYSELTQCTNLLGPTLATGVPLMTSTREPVVLLRLLTVLTVRAFLIVCRRESRYQVNFVKQKRKWKKKYNHFF